MANRTLYILDGHYQIYRSYHAPFGNLTSPSGEPTKAVHVFCQSLFNMIRKRNPDHLIVVLDTSDETVFRRDIFPEYKATRDAPPEDLTPQKERILSIIEAMGVPMFRKERYEADDLIATIVERLAGEPIDLYLASKDKDLEQLICERTPGGGSVRMIDIAKDVVIDEAVLRETKGYGPEQAVDIQTLTGDNVDNVPGIKGIGLKTAAKLIEKYGTAEAVLEHADELTPKQRENVLAFREQMPITRELVTLKRDVAFDFDLDAAVFDGVRVRAVRPIFEELGFGRLAERLENFADGEGTEGPRDQGTQGVGYALRTGGHGEQGTGNRGQGAAVVGDVASGGAEYRLVDTADGLRAFVKELAAQAVFAFDTETTGLSPVASELVGLSFSWEAGTGAYLPVRSAIGRVLDRELVVKTLKPILENPAIGKVGQNLKYDIVVLKQVGIDVAGVAFDTMIASFLLSPLRRSHGMDYLARELLDYQTIPISELIGKGKNQITIDMVDPRQVCEYAGEDADVTWRLYETLAEQMDGAPFEKLFRDIELPLIDVLAQMEHNGIAIDVSILERLSREMQKRMEELSYSIHDAAGRPFNIDSTKQLAEVLFDEQKLPVVRRTKTGRSTDADTLESLQRTTDNPIPPLVLEYRELAKLKGTYVDVLPRMVCKRTSRVHASFHQTGAITGRLSSSDPNLQNVPVRTEVGRQIRGAFVTDLPDHVLLVADYSQIELRVLAHYCQDEALMEAFRTGVDIHTFVAAQVNGVAIEEVTKDQRSRAKAVNFGIIYGQTAFGLSRSLNISRGDAEAFIGEYFLRYPRIRAFIDDCIATAKRDGYVETILGRRRPIDGLDSRNRQRAALAERLAVNSVIQGSAADLIKRAMIDIDAAIRSGELSSRMLLQVHDELVFESPAKQADAEAARIRELMTTALPLDVPIAVDIAHGRSWLDCK